MEEKNPLNVLIGNKIRQLREENQMSQEELGKILGITTSGVGRYEIGASKPSFEILNKIADHFNVSTDWMLGRTESRSVDSSEIVAGIAPELLKKRLEKEIKLQLRERIIQVFEE